jgi:NAD(P)H-dependent flavin oxidoreductase YrpB (nitropropane dioxygenase family)
MNRVLAHTGARYPIVQAPMGWIARTQLASAVSRAGGLGIIETSSGETEACQHEINKMKALDLPFWRQFADQVSARRRDAEIRLQLRRQVRHDLSG